MRGAFVVSVVWFGCNSGDPALRVEPLTIDAIVELDAASRVPLVVTVDGSDVTAQATYTLDGAPLGTVDATGFLSDGRTGGRATIAIAYRDSTIDLPVHVGLHSTRIIEGPADAPALFAAAHDVVGFDPIDPGEGAVVPPNLGRLDVSFTAPAGNDLHEVAIIAPDLELRVYGAGAVDARTVALTEAEWDAAVRTRRGASAELHTRSLAAATPGEARATTSRIAIADLPFANQILFTGKKPDEPPQMWSYDPVHPATDRWASGPAGTCLGCHLAISRDGSRIAAGGTEGTVGGGVLVDAKTRFFAVPPSAAVGAWTAAAFGPDNTLVTANTGILTIRDATTALPRATVTPELPANQPAISHDGALLAYVAGAIDKDTTQPATVELRTHSFDGATATLGPARTLVPARAADFVKLPDFSSDDRWILYTRVANLFRTNGSVVAVRADGSGTPLELATDIGLARFASPIVAARSGGADAEPMTWIVMRSDRPVGGRPQATIGQLWVMAFYPERGTASRPFCLPGQAQDVAVLHAPIVFPQP